MTSASTHISSSAAELLAAVAAVAAVELYHVAAESEITKHLQIFKSFIQNVHFYIHQITTNKTDLLVIQ